MTTGAYHTRNSWDRILGIVTAATLSLTILSGTARTPWEDMGSGAHLTSAHWTGTAPGTIQARSSASVPDSTGDQAVIQPATADWQASLTVDPAVGVPSGGGWLNNGVTVTIDGDYLKVVSPSTNAIYKYSANAIVKVGERVTIRFRMGLVAGTTGDSQVYANLPLGSNTYQGTCQVAAGMYTNGTDGYIAWGGTLTTFKIPDWAYGRHYDIIIDLRSSSADVRPPYAQISYRPVDEGESEETTDRFVIVTNAATIAGNDWPLWRIGGYWVGGVTATYGKIRYFSGTEWVTITSGQTVASLTAIEQAALGRQYVQVRGFTPGTLLSLNLQSSETPPAAPATVTATAVGDDLIVTWDAVADCKYLVELHDGASVVETALPGEALTASFAAPGDGDYTVRVSTVSAANVPSASYTASSSVTLPASDLYVPPTTPATPTAYAEPSPASPAWSTDVENLILSEPAAPGSGQLPVTTIWLGYQPTPGAAPVKLTTLAGFTSEQVAASSVANGSVTWASGTGIHTAFAALVTAIRGLFPTALLCQGNDDGQVVTWSGGINPTAQGLYECSITGKLDEQWAGRSVKVKLAAVGNGGDQTYLKRTYTATVADDGTYTVTGLLRDVPAYFTVPDDSTVLRQLPDGSAATFASLSEPEA
jgi:hypothetical protein